VRKRSSDPNAAVIDLAMSARLYAQLHEMVRKIIYLRCAIHKELHGIRVHSKLCLKLYIYNIFMSELSDFTGLCNNVRPPVILTNA